MPTLLSVNVNAIAMLRNRRDLPWPDLLALGRIALQAGAQGLTVHPRPDQRHVRFSDLPDLRRLIDDEFPAAEFNIEGFPSEDFLQLVERIRPEQVTLVPDDPTQATSDHGYDFVQERKHLEAIVGRLKQAGMRVSIFADADPDQMDAAAQTGCDRIELYTGPYGSTHDDPSAASEEIERLGRTANRANELGLQVNAGHDLTVANLPPLIARIPQLAEVSIGHALTADSLVHGMAETVRRFRRACGQHDA